MSLNSFVNDFLSNIRTGFRSFAIGTFPYGRFLLTLVAAVAGGWLFWMMRTPLPWMLGAMTACILASLTRLPVTMPLVVRTPMMMVIGVMLGAGFSPHVIDYIYTCIPTILGLFILVIVCALGSALYFRFACGFDTVTAYFAGMPGGLLEMMTLGEEKGGDSRAIALVHSARIFMIVFSLPFLIGLVEGVNIGRSTGTYFPIWDIHVLGIVWFILTAVVGVIVGRLVKLPARHLFGPMLVSALIHGLGWTEFRPPTELVNTAQVIMGAYVGCRFAGVRPLTVIRILTLSIGSAVILIGSTVAFAFIMARLSIYPVTPLLLAYSPGGVAEMSLVALALQVEVAFVVAHHIARLLLVMAGAGPLFAMLEWCETRIKGSSPSRE